MKVRSTKQLISSVIGLVGLTLVFGVQAENISQQELLNRMASQTKPIIVDVRTPQEYAQGHLPGAINITHKELKARLAELDNYKDTTLVLYCRSGTRAGIANKILAGNGFSKLDHLTGDFNAWQAKGLPLETVAGAVALDKKVKVANPCGL